MILVKTKSFHKKIYNRLVEKLPQALDRTVIQTHQEALHLHPRQANQLLVIKSGCTIHFHILAVPASGSYNSLPMSLQLLQGTLLLQSATPLRFHYWDTSWQSRDIALNSSDPSYVATTTLGMGMAVLISHEEFQKFLDVSKCGEYTFFFILFYKVFTQSKYHFLFSLKGCISKNNYHKRKEKPQ